MHITPYHEDPTTAMIIISLHLNFVVAGNCERYEEMGMFYAVFMDVLLILWLTAMISIIVGVHDPGTYQKVVKDIDPYVNEIKKQLNIPTEFYCPDVYEEGIGDAFISAVEDDKLSLVKCIATKEDFDINYRDKKFGKTGLMKACDYTHHGIALFLIENGADVNMKDKRGKNVIEYASDSGNKEVMAAIRARSDWDRIEPFADELGGEVKTQAQRLGEQAAAAVGGDEL